MTRGRAEAALAGVSPSRPASSPERGAVRWLAALALLLLGAAPEPPLRVIVIDVEGGTATLYITPHRHSLLIDAGWPTGMGGGAEASAARIVATARAQRLARIDTLIVTHYHVDHVGGAIELLRTFPVGEVVDHGPNRELAGEGTTPDAAAPAILYPAYLTAIGARPHRVMRAGDSFRVDALTVTAVSGDGAVIARPLAEAGAAHAECGAAPSGADVGGEENPRSLGVVLTYGRARVLSLGDTTWNKEVELVCPRDRIGPVDMMLSDNHGSGNGNAPALIDTVQPRVVVVANGRTKGAASSTFDTVSASPRLAALWQLHFAERSHASNTAPERIANPAGAADAGHPLQYCHQPAHRRARDLRPLTPYSPTTARRTCWRCSPSPSMPSVMTSPHFK